MEHSNLVNKSWLNVKEELRKSRKHDELDNDDEEDSDSGSDSGSDSDSDIDDDKNVLFGNIVFNDGSQVTSDLSKIRNSAEKKKQKGPANKETTEKSRN